MNPNWDNDKPLPSDLPRSLNDRRKTSGFGGETEIYDAWQGEQLMAALGEKPNQY
jgi:hypothetical protein